MDLECIGYFRKQEAKYWWPINVGELARIQLRAHEELRQSHIGLRLGCLITVAALSFRGISPPKVAVPVIDRIFDEDPNDIWSMVYALFWSELPDRAAMLPRWLRLLRDLIPAELPDPDGVPISIDGVAYLRDQVMLFAAFHHEHPACELVGILESLLLANKNYAEMASQGTTGRGEHAEWRNAVMKWIKRAEATVSLVLRMETTTSSGHHQR